MPLSSKLFKINLLAGGFPNSTAKIDLLTGGMPGPPGNLTAEAQALADLIAADRVAIEAAEASVSSNLAAMQVLADQVTAIAAAISNANEQPRTIVFSLEGQSNMQSWSGDDGGRDFPAGVLEYNQAGQLVQAAHRLLHQRNNGPTDSIDPAIEFCYAYLAGRPDDTVIVVPSANPGTGFGQGDWNPGDPSYNAAVSRLNACLALDPDYVFGGWLWVQGERDTQQATWAANHANAFDAFLAARRAAVTGGAGATVPFLMGGMSPDWLTETAERLEVQASIEDAPIRNLNVYYVSNAGLSGVVGDEIHLDAASQRAMGQRFYNAYIAATAAGPQPSVGVWEITGTTINQSPGGISTPSVSGTTVS